eukprot:GHVS01098875.1.p1 GENE.GHVS01098875.1~~GHVS01098875.1.p1  ORF type:complete len:387 (+),score=82.61 GHVS01098875.1:47-1162(+)
MEQVRKDMEANPDLKKAMQDFEKTGAKEKAENVKSFLSSSSLSAMRERVSKLADENETLKKVKAESQRVASGVSGVYEKLSTDYEAVQKVHQTGKQLMGGVCKVSGVVVDKLSQVVSDMTDDKSSAHKRADKWKQDMAIKRYKKNQMKSEGGENVVEEEEMKQEEATMESSLVVSQESAWDRFGTKLKDMPFLQSFYENPVIGKLFGETEIASSIRGMKEIDPSFRLPDFMEVVEHVIAPHLVESFLCGDVETLKAHCGEAAFAAVYASIKERQTMKVELDPSILILKNVELRGARTVQQGESPWFIFTFTAQQINCLRDRNGKVVTGAVDDIREVVYSVALCKHPEPDTEGLAYPWMVKELAIIGNAPSY